MGDSECLFWGGDDECLPEAHTLVWQQKCDSLPSSDYPSQFWQEHRGLIPPSPCNLGMAQEEWRREWLGVQDRVWELSGHIAVASFCLRPVRSCIIWLRRFHQLQPAPLQAVPCLKFPFALTVGMAMESWASFKYNKTFIIKLQGIGLYRLCISILFLWKKGLIDNIFSWQ